MYLIDCTYEKHAAAILAILNEAIVNSTALYDYKPRSPESMIKWFEGKAAGAYPVVGIVSDEGELLGFGSYGPFRAFPAYKYTVERIAFYAMCGKYRTVGNSAQDEICRMLNKMC
jgi:phosphinothricin acetyltransferase